MTADPAAGRAAAVVLGAGSGSRVGAAANKVFLPLAGRPVIAWSFRALAAVPAVGRMLMVIRESDRPAADTLIAGELADLPVEIVVGGDTRHASETAALEHLGAEIEAGTVDVVLIHDGARPVVTPDLITRLIDAARAHGAVFPGVASDEMRTVGPDGTLDLTDVPQIVRAQTPQGFRSGPLLDAYRRAATDGFVGTDTAACFQRYRPEPLIWLPGDPENLKITFPEDLPLAEAALRRAGAQSPW